MTYLHGYADAVLRSQRWRSVENSAGYLRDLLSEGTSVLDVGCGPGSLTLDIARLVAPGRVVGVDAEPTVLAEARAAAKDQSLDNVEFHEGDACALGYDDSSFDIAHAHQLLQHLAHPERALAEMGRVTRAGGHVAARDTDYSSWTWFPEAPLLERWRALYREVARQNGGEPDAGRRLKSWALAAGLEGISSSASAWCFSTLDDRSWWAEIWAERTSSGRLGEQAVALGLAATTELDELATAWRRWALEPAGWLAVVHGEVLCSL